MADFKVLSRSEGQHHMNWHMDGHMLESCASLVSQFLAMSFQPQKQLPSGKGCCFLEKLTCKKAMWHLMDNQYSLQEACAESTLNGEVTWRTICIVGVFHGSTKLGLEQESCQL
jgi:hypothetical protein